MRNCLLMLVLACAGGPNVRADDAADLLARAVKASAGSDEALARRKFCIVKQSGVIYLPGGAAVATRECTFALPNRVKWVGEMRPTTGAVSFVIVLNGLKGWSKTVGPVIEMSPTEYDAVQNEAYTLWVASLVPGKSSSLKWELLKDGVVDGKPTRVLKCSQAGRPVVTLHFDAATMLVVKATYAGMENLQPRSKDFLLSAYKEYDGQQLPGKVQVYQDGKKIEEWTNSGYRFVAAIEDREFAKP